MEITGKIIEILPEQSGESARGPWRKQEYVLETDGQYPKKICFMAWGDKIEVCFMKMCVSCLSCVIANVSCVLCVSCVIANVSCIVCDR